jgi:hypothetical protein
VEIRMIDLTCSSFARATNVTWRTFDGNSILLHLESGVYYTLNPAGTLIWELLDRRIAGQELLTVLRDRYSVEEEEARRDLVDLLEEFAREGLISIHEHEIKDR